MDNKAPQSSQKSKVQKKAELQRARVSCLGRGVKKFETVCVLEKAQNTDEQLYF